jgi:hypothetical protein
MFSHRLAGAMKGMMLRRIATAAATTLLVAVGLVGVASPASAATNQCIFGPNQVTQPGSVRFVLQTSAAVTAYKEVRAENAAGTIIGEVDTEGAAHGPVAFTVVLAQVQNLFFIKAKALGVHCAVYRLPKSQLNLLQVGEQVRFFWSQDH